MQKTGGQIREAGYEALFLLGGSAGAALPPGRGAEDGAEDGADGRSEPRMEEGKLRRLAERGLIEGVGGDEGRMPRLTSLGRAVFDGGRDVEGAWQRSWDAQWRLLMFDLPRESGSARVKFWRWLQAHHFGKLQGSVWVSPDPFPEVEDAFVEFGLDPAMLVMVEGDVVGRMSAPDIVAMAWDFEAIHSAYDAYIEFAQQTLRQHERKSPTPAGLKEFLRQDRKLWWEAVRPDPLLPKALLPSDYVGSGAWNLRRKLLSKLGKGI